MEREFDRPGVRVRVIDHQKNLGLAATRNTGYRHARCPTRVFQIDADDLMEPTTLEKCVAAALASAMSRSSRARPSASRATGTSGTAGSTRAGVRRREPRDGDGDGAAETRGRPSAGSTRPSRGGMEDWDFWLRLAEHGHWGGTINVPRLVPASRQPARRLAQLASSRGLERFAPTCATPAARLLGLVPADRRRMAHADGVGGTNPVRKPPDQSRAAPADGDPVDEDGRRRTASTST